MIKAKRKNITKERIAIIIDECVSKNYLDLENKKFKYGAANILMKQFMPISRSTIYRICKQYFNPLPVKPVKRQRKKGGKSGRPTRVNGFVRESMDELGQELANNYFYFQIKSITIGLHARGITIGDSTVYRYFKFTIFAQEVKVYSVKFLLVDGPVWQDNASSPQPLGMESLNQRYWDGETIVHITLWKGVVLPYDCLLTKYHNVQDNLEDNAEYVAMGGPDTFRYTPVFKLIYSAKENSVVDEVEKEDIMSVQSNSCVEESEISSTSCMDSESVCSDI